MTQRQRLNEAIDTFRTQCRSVCHHPDKFSHIRVEDHDDGYGTWHKIDMLICDICGHEKRL